MENKKRTCKYCKKEISENSERCPYCGKEFGRPDIEKKIKNKSSNLTIWVGLMIGGVWGVINILFGILLIDDLSRGEGISLLRRIFLMPFSLAYAVSEYFNLVEPQSVIFFNFGSIIIGALIGLLIGWLIVRIKTK